MSSPQQLARPPRIVPASKTSGHCRTGVRTPVNGDSADVESDSQGLHLAALLRHHGLLPAVPAVLSAQKV
eukprot:640430-Prymnesium_polylepis.1